MAPLMGRSTPGAALAAAAVLFGTLLSVPAWGQASSAGDAARRIERPGIVVVPDRRITIVPSPEARARVLADMRQYLSGLQSMFESLSRQDLAGAARTARALEAIRIDDVALVSPSPFETEFRELAVKVRRDFGRIADDAERRRDLKDTMGRIGIAMQTCLACHQTFQLNEIFRAPARQGSTQQAVEAGERGMVTPPDSRIPLFAAPNERAYLLRRMRLYLAGLQTLLVALSQDDWATASETAAALATIDVRGVSLSAAFQHDVAFRDLALDVHGRFDAVAQAARARDTGETLARIGEAMRQCVACHRTYRLDELSRAAPRATGR
jgi:cytochrome c556